MARNGKFVIDNQVLLILTGIIFLISSTIFIIWILLFVSQVSYSPSKDIDLTMAGGPYVYKGTRVKGTLNVFGYNIRVDVKISEDVSDYLHLNYIIQPTRAVFIHCKTCGWNMDSSVFMLLLKCFCERKYISLCLGGFERLRARSLSVCFFHCFLRRIISIFLRRSIQLQNIKFSGGF